MLWFIQCSRPIYKSELHATPHPTSLTLGHLPPGGRLFSAYRIGTLNYNLNVEFKDRGAKCAPVLQLFTFPE